MTGPDIKKRNENLQAVERDQGKRSENVDVNEIASRKLKKKTGKGCYDRKLTEQDSCLSLDASE